MRISRDSDDPYRVLPDVHFERGRLRRIARPVLVVSIVIVTLLSFAWGAYQLWYLRQVNPPGAAQAPMSFSVTEVDTLDSVSRRLQQDGFIVNAGVFRDYVAEHGGLVPVAGFYTIRPRDHMGNIVRVLRTPPDETFTRITFPEGFTLEQMAARIDKDLPSVRSADFLDKAGADPAIASAVRSTFQPEGITSLEGLLFPDTYFVSGDETAGRLVQQMVQLMERVGRQEGLDDPVALAGLGADRPLTSYEVLIVASIIEKEARFAEDRGRIARVIYNRLALGMPLEIDATLMYNQDPERPFLELKATDTPYNTYLHTGLPPTPISNPGRAAIAAALNPSPNPSSGNEICREIADGSPCLYLYYVLEDKDGHHVFAATLEQHQANVQAAIAAGVL